jgi:chromosome segregation ATPase
VGELQLNRDLYERLQGTEALLAESMEK